MLDDLEFEKIELEWEGSHTVFDDFPMIEASSKGAFELRTMLSMRRASLKDIVLAFCGYMTIYDSNTINQSPLGNLVLGLCAVILVNPFDIKILRGKGIDDLIEACEFDEDSDERFITKGTFLKFCTKNDIPENLLHWLEGKGFVYQNEGKIFFRRSLQKGRIFSKA